MHCPFCDHSDTQVIDSRVADDGAAIRRRRQCAHCKQRFTTYERADLSFPRVVKKDGRRVAYDRSKLSGSLHLALRKRPVNTEQVDAALSHIEAKLMAHGKREVDSGQLGEWVMHELHQLDQVAYIRFASVYRSFEDIDEFRALVDEVQR